MCFKVQKVTLTLLALVIWLAGESRAGLIVNGSFETGTNPPSQGSNGVALLTGSTAITGWTVIGGTSGDGLAWLPNGNSYGVSTPFGNDFLDLTGYHDNAPYFGVSQSISTVVGQAYTLSLDLGVDESNSLYSGPIAVQVMAGPVTQTLTDTSTGTGNIWTAFNVNFTATSTSTTISIQGTQGNQYIGLDNVSVAAVPEPSTLIMVGMATMIVGACSWARRRNRSTT